MPGETHDDVTGEIMRRSADFIDKTVYVCTSRLADPERWPPPPAVILEHIDYMDDLEAEGVLLAAGPFTDDAGTRLTDGMIVVHSDSRADAEKILSRDPFHAHGFRRGTVEPWQLHQGLPGVRIWLSDQRRELQ